jgi:hypothetical protein
MRRARAGDMINARRGGENKLMKGTMIYCLSVCISIHLFEQSFIHRQQELRLLHAGQSRSKLCAAKSNAVDMMEKNVEWLERAEKLEKNKFHRLPSFIQSYFYVRSHVCVYFLAFHLQLTTYSNPLMGIFSLTRSLVLF